ncbi:MAG: isopropylmalate isomerase, partial [Pseudomonadota bacterium]
SRSARVPTRERTIWLGLAVALALLGVNKQLDLQSALTEIGRILAKGQNWYEHRHEVQRFFVEVVAVLAVGTALVLAFVIRRMPRATQLAVVGACLLLGFVVVRAASFHHVDHFIGIEFFGLRANWVLEIGGIACILAAALFRRPRPSATARAR